MAKLTAYFNDKPIQSQIFESGIVHIGRDKTNDFIIDNIAIAPTHAVVIIKEDNCIIKQLNDEFPIQVNDLNNKETFLQNNDKISLGKHTIIYSTTETIIPAHDHTMATHDIASLNEKPAKKVKMPEANLQVLDGQHIGRILPLKNPITRLGQTGSGIAIISRRKQGYFISSLEESATIIVNKKNLGDQILALVNNDIVVIDKISMQFFLKN
ncbi:MAG: FHA domain-containing protein [Gammaproteobacteria bacterium]|nr:FHA domain-containing protein [Methylococcaceae bacterium]